MTLDKKQRFSIAYAERAPKSICLCGHSGDGAHSDHKETGQAGHGACKKCPKGVCMKFSWAKFHDLFQRALDKIEA